MSAAHNAALSFASTVNDALLKNYLLVVNRGLASLSMKTPDSVRPVGRCSPAGTVSFALGEDVWRSFAMCGARFDITGLQASLNDAAPLQPDRPVSDQLFVSKSCCLARVEGDRGGPH
jgi:hypothetical protein